MSQKRAGGRASGRVRLILRPTRPVEKATQTVNPCQTDFPVTPTKHSPDPISSGQLFRQLPPRRSFRPGLLSESTSTVFLTTIHSPLTTAVLIESAPIRNHTYPQQAQQKCRF
jgi:hypothetical protein